MVDISNVFQQSTKLIKQFYQEVGVGFYVPSYQRPYSWDRENIDQLMEDICSGVDLMLSDNKIIHFMGTLILVTESNPQQNIHPKDETAFPSRIDNVIDGQQRISTICLLSCLLYEKIHQISSRLPDDEVHFSSIKDYSSRVLKNLLKIVSVDIDRGTPTKKPKIIRSIEDRWTHEGDDSNYNSQVSSYLAKFIRHVELDSEAPGIPTNGEVGVNLRKMKSYLNKIEKSYDRNDPIFPAAWEIVETIDQRDFWEYNRDELLDYIKNFDDKTNIKYRRSCSLVQLFAFIHFMTDRCCFTVIHPTLEDYAFDMFQSLNATGTPLTSLETFKPLIVNTVNNTNGPYETSATRDCYDYVEKIFSGVGSSAKKNKLTNEYLSTFSLSYDGTRSSNQFSWQRRWLTETFKNKTTSDDKHEFVKRMGNVAEYWENVIGFDPTVHASILRTQNVPPNERKIGALCALYLNDAGHKMANSILSRFYANTIRGVENSEQDFIKACKAVAAFFTLWRSSHSNAGLDDVYRNLFSNGLPEENINPFSWEQADEAISVSDLKTYFKHVLANKNISIEDKTNWSRRAVNNLRYDTAKSVCKFALFVASHDTTADPAQNGLMHIAAENSRPYLTPEYWVSSHLKTIEHIAPQQPQEGSGWDLELYQDDNVQKVGNLTLLPVEINISAGNNGWIRKYVYYQHISQTEINELERLSTIATENNVEMSEETIDLLKSTPFNHHVIPIVRVGSDGDWDNNLVATRSERICSILWDRIWPWLN